MNVHISYRDHKTPDIEKEINHLIEKLRKRLQVFRPELVHLKGVIEQNSPREGNHGFAEPATAVRPDGSAGVARPALPPRSRRPPTTYCSRSASTKICCETRTTGRGAGWSDFRPESHVPFEETVAAVQVPTASSDDVRSYVNANLARLERFVEREFYFRETAEEIIPDSISKEEVIDEAIARALGEWQREAGTSGTRALALPSGYARHRRSLRPEPGEPVLRSFGGFGAAPECAGQRRAGTAVSTSQTKP